MAPDPTVKPHVAIPMRDGVLLSAAIHYPSGFEDSQQRYPALIEYHPYRKDDRSCGRASDHDYFAKNGFVSVRLDVRGTGSSTGANTDEYMPIETQDGHDAVEWLAAQPWSNGRVGMFGSSYGGFTCFQVAMLRPAHLKAIVPIYATDDRYTDDCHYKGGAFKAYYDTGTYGTMMVALNALPPDPELFGDGWEDEWKRRLDSNTPYMLEWLSHQVDGPYWRTGSLRGQYDKVEAATFIIGGWQDGYPQPSVRAFQNLGCQKKLLMGPWNHSRPNVAVPGPNIDYLNEIRRWFDLHLKGLDDGVSNEPAATFYVQSYDPPDPSRRNTSGEWAASSSWPPEGSASRTFYLAGADRSGHRALVDREVVSENVSHLPVDPATGVTGGLWSGGLPWGLPGDQRRDEALSLTYTSPPLSQPLTIAGAPVARLTVSADTPVALFVVKIADVAPDGSSALVTRGLLNGTRRNGMSSPEPMESHRVYKLEIEFDSTVWRFEAGHRIRLAVSGSDFPNSWPTPMHTVLSLYAGGRTQSQVQMPVLEERERPDPPTFLPAPGGTPPRFTPEPDRWSFTEDPLDSMVTLRVHRGGISEARERVSMFSSDDLQLFVHRNSPFATTAVGTTTMRLRNGDRLFESVARQVIASDASYFRWQVDLSVKQNGDEVANMSWRRDFPRELL